MRGFAGTGSHADEIMHQFLELPLEECIAVISVRGKGGTVNPSLAGDEVAQHRNADGAAHIAREAADSGDLIEFFPRYAHVVEGADRYEDQRNADDLNDAVNHHRSEVHAEIDIRHMEKSKGRDREADSDDDSRVEFGGEDSSEPHHIGQSDASG